MSTSRTGDLRFGIFFSILSFRSRSCTQAGFNLGGGTVSGTVTSPAVNDGVWHSLRVLLQNRNLTLVLDDVPVLQLQNPYNYTSLDVMRTIVLGYDPSITAGFFNGYVRHLVFGANEYLEQVNTNPNITSKFVNFGMHAFFN